ncbi:hypothetical protein Sango_3046300 [Sesamum angolense]|uniref:DUF4283 domain-containing protein n=1 Tax=Sesamum angolense TaxID=2727404 RepID=A0AAE1W196_9LAMI|nr:hypothetical protein Sango_3046300 [Sesamum angolense]
MLPKESNSLCPLSHNTHTDSTHTTHSEPAGAHVENPDGNVEADASGGDSHGLDGKESPSTREEFDFDAFYELANWVLNGDLDAMANLNSLRDRWEQKFKTSKNLALKSVTGRLSTPFRPRISLLPRRSVRTGTDSLTDLVSCPVNRPGIANHGCTTFPSQEMEAQELPIPQISNVPAQLLVDFSESASQDSRKKGPSWDLAGSELPECRTEAQDCSPTLDSNPPTTVQDGLRNQSDIYIGNVKLQAEFVDTIAGAFLQSSRKTLHFVPPTRQNGEVIIRPTKEVVDNGSKKWRSTAVGYFLGKRPRLAMEDVIEGGPWLFQGQPIVLQPWEQGMSIRRQKHTQIPVWIRLRHLPMEYWTDEGLSTVASGVGTPLYTDGITKDCSRLDFARVCVMLDFNSALPKHLVVISPVLWNGKEDPKRIDVEYEWLPQRVKIAVLWGMFQLPARLT